MEDQTYETGDDVFVIDSSFEPVVQRGVVDLRDSDAVGETVDVQFATDPFDSDDDTSRSVGVTTDQIVHADAGARETLRFMGLSDLIEPEDE